MTPSDLPTFDDVRAAAARLQGHAHRTPVLTSRTADEATGAQFFFKCENLQRMGAFKFRGAFNALAQFDAAQRRAGVVAFSSGNHAQAVALAARLLGMPATIVMPHDAPAAKLAATRGYGAEVRLYERYTEDREQIGRQLAAERGMTLIPPYDHPHVIAGQGTAALELLEDAGPLDALFVPLGGGGLLSGCALAARALAPGCKVFGVEPEAGDDGQRSLREGRIAGAGLDVFSSEPLALSGHPMSPLFALPNVVMLPHLTFYTAEAMDRLERETLERCDEVLSGRPVLVKSHDPRLRAQKRGVRFV